MRHQIQTISIGTRGKKDKPSRNLTIEVTVTGIPRNR